MGMSNDIICSNVGQGTVNDSAVCTDGPTYDGFNKGLLDWQVSAMSAQIHPTALVLQKMFI